MIERNHTSNAREFPDVPEGFRVFKLEGLIYSYYKKGVDNPEGGQSVGFMYAGVPNDGRFSEDTIKAFESRLGFTLNDMCGNIEGIGYCAGRSSDPEEAFVLYAVSLDGNSELFRADLTDDDWYPKHEWKW